MRVIFNPRETGNEPNMRLTRWFRADGMINGGGQIIEEIGPKPKDDYKISFGGHLYRFGTDAPVCEWQVNLHNVSIDELDKGKFYGTLCTAPPNFPLGPDGEVVSHFAVYGTWNGDPGYTMVIRLEDAGEPGSLDTIRFELHNDPGQSVTPLNAGPGTAVYDSSDKATGNRPGEDFKSESSNSGTARTYLDNGNLQLYLM